MKFLTNIDKATFNAFVAAHPKGHFLQSFDWGEFKSHNKEWTMETVGVADDNGLLIAAAMLLLRYLPVIKRPFIYIARGFVMDYHHSELLSFITKEVAQYAKEKKAIFFKIDPDILYAQRNIIGEPTTAIPENEPLVHTLKTLGYRHQGFTTGFSTSIQPRFTIRLCLKDKSEKEIFSRMRSTTKQMIKVAEKKGVEIYEGTRQDLVHLEALSKETAKRNQFISRPLSYYEQMYDALMDKGMLKLIFARIQPQKVLTNVQAEMKETITRMDVLQQRLNEGNGGPKQEKKIHVQLSDLEGKMRNLHKQLAEIEQIAAENGEEVIISGMLYVQFGNKIWSLYAADDVKFRSFSANYLIHWHGITEAMNDHVEIYDFFGISGLVDKDDPVHGLYVFKSGFGGDFTEFIGEFDYVISPFYYYLWSVALPRFKKLRQKLRRKT